MIGTDGDVGWGVVMIHPVIALKVLFCAVWSVFFLVAEVYGYEAGDA